LPFKIAYESAAPDAEELNTLVSEKGPNLFYGSVELRKRCCEVRKTRPFQKILSTVDAWITGLRGGQSVTRTGLAPVEWDDAHSIYRISPLYNWREEDTFTFARNHGLPVSDLYNRGYRSIGCAPCTRAIGADDDIRSGRWWWEEPEHRECGLHGRKAIER